MNTCPSQYGIYKVTMSDGFKINVNAADTEAAIDAVLAAGIVHAPRSAFKNVALVRSIKLYPLAH